MTPANRIWVKAQIDIPRVSSEDGFHFTHFKAGETKSVAPSLRTAIEDLPGLVIVAGPEPEAAPMDEPPAPRAPKPEPAMKPQERIAKLKEVIKGFQEANQPEFYFTAIGVPRMDRVLEKVEFTFSRRDLMEAAKALGLTKNMGTKTPRKKKKKKKRGKKRAKKVSDGNQDS